MDFEPFFKEYETLVKQVEDAFAKVKAEFESCVKCKVGCSDCCNAVFDLTIIEAIYIKSKFDAKFKGDAQERILERANKADRQAYKLKRQAYKDHQEGKPESVILEEMAAARIRCPLLNEDELCDLYEARPITCRLYGIPTRIGDKARTCTLSGFEPGKAYPTVKLDQIHQRLSLISFNLAQSIQTRFPQLAEMLVPLSMALLTEYSEEYLGVRTQKKDEKDEKNGST